jgi:hypothetical protein
MLVVDGIITNEKKPQEIKLSLAMSKPMAITPVASGASVYVQAADSTYTFEEIPEGSGIYISSNPFRASAGKTYHLTIEYRNTKFTASATMAGITALPAFRFNPEDSALFSYIYEDDAPSMQEVFFDWSDVEGYREKDPGSCKAVQYFYSLETIDISQFLGPAREIVRFPIGTKIHRTKYSLSLEHEYFLRTILLETSWRGGNFDVLPGNSYTNLSEGATGFFGVCMVLHDSSTAGK